MGQLIETRVEELHLAKQSAQGTPNTTPAKQARKVGGDLQTTPEHGQGRYSDGKRFAEAQDHPQTLTGQGSPAFQMQPGPTAFALATMLGSEAVAQNGTSGDHDHTITPGSSGSWLTAMIKVGDQVGPRREQFNDCRQQSLRLEASTSNPIGVVTPQILSLDPGEIYTSDPGVALDTDEALIHTQGEGRFKIDGEVFNGTSQWALVINDAAEGRYGDSVVPKDIGFGVATVALEGVTFGLNQQGFDRYNDHVYGIESPAAGAKPLTGLPGLGSFEVDLQQGSHQEVVLTGSPTGGTFTLSLGSNTTAAIDFDATAAAVQTALEGIVGVGRVTCSGGPLPGTAVDIQFIETQVALTGDGANLTGGTSPDVSITDHGYHRGLKITCASVKWQPGLAVAGNVEGGTSEIALAGELRDVANTFTCVVRNGDASAY